MQKEIWPGEQKVKQVAIKTKKFFEKHPTQVDVNKITEKFFVLSYPSDPKWCLTK